MSTVPASRLGLAIAAALLAGAAHAADLGTLFLTADERDRLDKLRRGEAAEVAGEVQAVPGAPPALTGFVQRSDGRNTVWINGRPVGVVAPKTGPSNLDPKAVRAYQENPEGVRVERKPAR